MSTREGAGCQQGRELAVNEGGSWLSMREGAGCQQGRELFFNESRSHLSLREAPVLQKRTPFMDKGGRTLFFNGGRVPFIDERWRHHSSSEGGRHSSKREGGQGSSSGGGCHLLRKDTVCQAGHCLSSRTLSVERGCHLLREGGYRSSREGYSLSTRDGGHCKSMSEDAIC